MKFETFKFARYFSALFCIHLFLHNMGVLHSNLSDNILYFVTFTFKFTKHEMVVNM